MKELVITWRPFAGRDNLHHHVDLGQLLRDHTVHHAVHGAAVAGLKARRVDEHELLVVAREHTVDAVTRGLCLARHDGKLGADQRVGQCGFADIGPPHDGNVTAAKWFRHLSSWDKGADLTATVRRLRRRGASTAPCVASSCSIASCAAACSAARRLEPAACTRISSWATSQATSNN